MFHSKPLIQTASESAFCPSAGDIELLNEGRYRVAVLALQVGSDLGEQRHLYAEKQITVLKGCAEIHQQGQTSLIHEGATHKVPSRAKHVIRNAGKIELKMLELRSGPCVEDDDRAS